MFNNFHCTFLRHYENSFLTMYRSQREHKNNWITKGIEIPCRSKTNLYITCRYINDPHKRIAIRNIVQS